VAMPHQSAADALGKSPWAWTRQRPTFVGRHLCKFMGDFIDQVLERARHPIQPNTNFGIKVSLREHAEATATMRFHIRPRPSS